MEHSSRNKDGLTLFSYEILGLVGGGGAAAHDLLRMARRGRILAWAGESQYYVEPKRLAALGYLSARKEPGRTRERTVYSLTDKGLRALQEHARTPATIVPFKSDALLRLLICDLVGEPVTRASIEALRNEIADLRRRIDDTDASARELPHRSTYLMMTNDFLRGLIDLHAELIERVERELAADELDTENASAPVRGVGDHTSG